jgi:hypothetical protein
LVIPSNQTFEEGARVPKRAKIERVVISAHDIFVTGTCCEGFTGQNTVYFHVEKKKRKELCKNEKLNSSGSTSPVRS